MIFCCCCLVLYTTSFEFTVLSQTLTPSRNLELLKPNAHWKRLSLNILQLLGCQRRMRVYMHDINPHGMLQLLDACAPTIFFKHTSNKHLSSFRLCQICLFPIILETDFIFMRYRSLITRVTVWKTMWSILHILSYKECTYKTKPKGQTEKKQVRCVYSTNNPYFYNRILLSITIYIHNLH
jgi:hypothetical protein